LKNTAWHNGSTLSNPAETMQVKSHQLIAPSLGTARSLTSFHYGPGGGQKIYIQSSLHADELPGMLTAWCLRRKLAELESRGALRGEVVIVPVPNPIGLNQRLQGHLMGRFEMGSSQNFNRNFLDLTPLVAPRLEGKLKPDATHNRELIRATMGQVLAEQRPATELESQRLALQRLSYDADVVLDLHCDWEAAMHIYTNPDTWDEVEPLARYLGAKASLLALNSVGAPFDEVHSFCWTELRQRFSSRPVPYGAISVTIESRGQRDVSHELAQQDADAIIAFLMHRGVVLGTAPSLPNLPFAATPLSGSALVVAPGSGVIVFRTEVGVWLDAGAPVADIVDPLADTVVTIPAPVSGVLYARHLSRFASAGMVIGHVAGAEPLRTGALLSP
jgi:predicted deacylase